MVNKKIVHISSSHSFRDTRIFYKECSSLAAHYEVYYLVPHDKNECINNVYIQALSFPRNRMLRFSFLIFEILKKSIQLKANIYHIHDPELLIIGPVLKLFGKKLIYDTHEDFPKQILNKHWIPKTLRFPLSKMFSLFEIAFCKSFDGIITPTKSIYDRFATIHPNVTIVRNYPILNSFIYNQLWKNRKNKICYIGSITRARGVLELIKALELCDTQLLLAGTFQPLQLLEEAKKMAGWKKVEYIGQIPHEKVIQEMIQCKIGMVCLHPIPNYLDSDPTKFYEYMLCGLPLICSNFPTFKKFVKENNCGITANPLQSRGIADAIQWLLTNQQEAKAFGESGKKMVLNHYNWESQSEKLISFYKTIL